MATYTRPNTVPDIVKRYGQGAVVDIWISNFGGPSHAGQWRVQGRSLVMDRDNDTESVDAYARRGITTINQWIKEYASYNGYTPYIAKVALAKRGNPYETKRGFQGRDRADAERMQRDYDFTNVPFQRAHAARKRREAAAQEAARVEAARRWEVMEASFTPAERARIAADDAERARDRRIYDAEKRIEALRAARRGGSRLPNAGGGRRKKTPYDTKFNRDGTVTLWDVYTQSWSRTSHPGDRDLAAMDAAERARVIRHLKLNPGGGRRKNGSAFHVGQDVFYNGEPAIVVATGLPGPYGDRIEVAVGRSRIITSGLDHGLTTYKAQKLPRLSELMYPAKPRGARKNPGGMTVEWLPANQAWIVLYGGKPSSLAGSNYFATKAELKQALASLGLKLTGNRITVA